MREIAWLDKKPIVNAVGYTNYLKGDGLEQIRSSTHLKIGNKRYTLSPSKMR